MQCCKMLKTIAVALCLIGIGLVGCGEKTPQDLRAEFEEQAESALSVMATFMGGSKKMPRPMIKCAAKKMTDMFSDEEIRLVMDSSFSERMNNPEKIMRIQRKMESEEIMNMVLLQCINETAKQ